MKANVQTFLSELYAIDPDLKTHEADLIPLVEQLLANDPGVAPDKDFVQTLRMQLQQHAATMQYKTGPTLLERLLYAFGGAVAVAVILPIAYFSTFSRTVTQHSDAPLFTYSVEKARDNAFGPLSEIGMMSARPQGGGGGPSYGMGGGGGMVASPIAPLPTDQAIAPPSEATAPSMDMKMMPYPMTQYQYVFSGSIKGLTDKVAVYKRNTVSKSTMSLSSLLGSFNLGTLDLSSFNGATVDSVNFSQHVAFGYQVFVNFVDSSVGISAMWDQWPQSKCQTQECYAREMTKISDIPADSEIANIATKFMTDHTIDLSHYGPAEVDNSWKIEYDRAPDKTNAYIPDVARVVFPLLIDDQPVYDQSGFKTGISVGVNIKQKRVSDVNGITDRTYQASDYKGVTDQAAVLKYLNSQQRFAIDSMPRDMKVNTVKVTLGEPTISYAVYYRWDTVPNQELLIPSLVFPVQQATGNDPTNSFYQTSVVVPLAQEILDQQLNQPTVYPMMDNIRM